jgi:uncharacterized DUF497 family protein
MRYVWDEKKAKSNFEKHGVRFEEAQVIWADPNSLEFFDFDSSLIENRYIRIGLNLLRGILLVVFCENENTDTIRIISARKATTQEKQEYEKELQSKRT